MNNDNIKDLELEKIQLELDGLRKRKKRRVKSETITAIATVTIAAIALIVSISDNSKTRSHNEISVRPFLSLASDMDKRALFIENVGMGPCFIDSVLIHNIGGKPANTQRESWVQVLSSIDYGFQFRPRLNIVEGTISQGGYINMLSLSDTTLTRAQVSKILDLVVRKVVIRVYYHSIYNHQDSIVWKPRDIL